MPRIADDFLSIKKKLRTLERGPDIKAGPIDISMEGMTVVWSKPGDCSLWSRPIGDGVYINIFKNER